MACDYYIYKYLKVYFTNEDYVYIELVRNQGYYFYNFDEDDVLYEYKVLQYIIKTLTQITQPITIYIDSAFIKSSYETKFKLYIENKLIEYDKNLHDITKILKVEKRYERCER